MTGCVSVEIQNMYHSRVEAVKFSSPSVMDIMRQFTIKGLDNDIQFLCLIKAIQQTQNVTHTQ
jgi:hypothetical protein